MNNTKFIVTGGWPLKLERLNEMQGDYQSLQAFGEIAGNYTIIKGCEVNGSNVAPGSLYINGELLAFEGGFLPEEGAAIVILEEEISREFENGELKALRTERRCAFGTSETSIPWANFKRPAPTKTIDERLNTVEAMLKPLADGDSPIFFCKPANMIPPGYVEDTDWKGRMPVGFDADALEFNIMNATGGNKNVTLTVDKLPAHKHKMFVSDSTNISNNRLNNYANRQVTYRGFGEGSADHDYTLSSSTDEATLGNTSAEGSGQAFSILNPYRVVLFIKWQGL